VPFVQIPPVVVNVNPVPNPAALTILGVWSVYVRNPPQPVERFQLHSLYLPVCVLCSFNTPPATDPTPLAVLTPRVLVSGQLMYEAAITIPLQPLAGNPGWLGGNGSTYADMNNPIPYLAGDTLTMTWRLSPPAPINATIVALGSAINDPSIPSFLDMPGSIGYSSSTVYDAA
jgi:hypothetical protein